MKNLQAIVFDIDGTLKQHSVPTIRQEYIEMLESLKDKYTLIVATGRPLAAIPQQLLRLFDYYVVSNGSAIFDYNMDKIHELEIDQNTNKIMLDHLNTNKINYGFKNAINCYYYYKYAQLPEYITNEKTITTTSLIPPNDEKILSYFIDLANKDYLYLSENCINLNFDHSGFEEDGIVHYEIYNKSAGKLNAAKYLCNKLNIELEDVMAFGDSENDLELIKHCGCGIAMDGARENVKQVADYICDEKYDFKIDNFVKEMELL